MRLARRLTIYRENNASTPIGHDTEMNKNKETFTIIPFFATVSFSIWLP